MIKLIVGGLLILSGIALGIYVGIWLCFIGGIVQVITAVRAEQLEALPVAIGIARIVFAGFAGWASAFLLLIPGFGIWSAIK